MANVTTKGRTYSLDSMGIISKSPIWIRTAVLYPNAAADVVTFYSWNENETPISTKDIQTVTTTLTTTITSTGNFPTATIDPGDIIKIHYTSTDNNVDTFSVLANADDNTITVDTAQVLTNEASKIYSWKVWRPFVSFKILSPGTEKMMATIDFGDKGRWFPNLFMDALSTSAVVALLIR